MEKVLLQVVLAAFLSAPLALDDREDIKAGRAALRRGDYAAAERLLKSVAEARPDSWEPRSRLLDAQLATGRLDDAEKTCRDYLFKHKGDVAASAALSRVMCARGDTAGALGMADAALKADAGEPLAIVARAESLAAVGRRADAVAALDGLAELHGKRRDAFMKDGLVAIAGGLILLDELVGKPEAYRLAVDTILSDVLRSDNDPAVRARLGFCHLSRHRPEAAAICFNDAIGVNPNLAAAHAGQGMLALERGDFDAAMQSAEKALATNPVCIDAHALRVRAALWRQDFDGAISAAKKAPKSPTIDALQGAVAASRGEAKPATPLAHYETARALVAARRFRDAAAAFDAAEGVFDARVLADLNRFRAEGKPVEYKPDIDVSDSLVVDLAKLFDRFGKEGASFEVPGFRVRVPGRMKHWLEPWAREALEQAGAELRATYGGGPALVTIIVSDKPAELAALSTGVPGGGCLGNVVAVPTPQATFSWIAAIRAGITQAFELHRAGAKTLPRWVLPGVGAHAARKAGFDVPDDWALLVARRDGKLKGPEDAPAAAAEFDAGRGRWNDPAFADEFRAWLEARFGRISVEMPPRPDDRRITDAESETKDAAKAVAAAADAVSRNELDRAVKFAKQAIAADAACAQGYSLLGQALQKRRKTDDAYEQLKRAVELGASDYRTFYTLGDVLEDLDSAKEAIAAFEKAKRAFPRFVPDPYGENVYRRLATIHQRTKDEEAELRELAALAAYEPLNVRDRRRLARSAVKDPQDALRWVRETAAVMPEDKSLHQGAAIALARKKEYARAIEMRLVVVALIEYGQDEPVEKATEFCEIAELHLAQSNREKAREYAKEAMRTVPGFERAQKLYERATGDK